MNKKSLVGIIFIFIVAVFIFCGVYLNKKDNSINAEDNARSSKNVKIGVNLETVTPEEVEITIYDTNEQPYNWGVEFGIQKKAGNEWEDLKYLHDIDLWEYDNSTCSLNMNGNYNQTLNIKMHYGELSEGTYRIFKKIDDINIYSSEFRIKK